MHIQIVDPTHCAENASASTVSRVGPDGRRQGDEVVTEVHKNVDAPEIVYSEYGPLTVPLGVAVLAIAPLHIMAY